MNPERHMPEDVTAGAKMLGASELQMADWEKNRQRYNPDKVAAQEKNPARPEQEDIRDIYKRQRSMLHRLKRAVGLES